MIRRRWLLVVVLAAAFACGGLGLALRRRTPPLATIVHGGEGPPTLVLLHGYGSSAERWAPFTQTIALPPGGRFVFPQGPEVTVPPDGPADGRAWWRMELAAHIPPGGSIPDFSAAHPPGIAIAAARVRPLLEDLHDKPGGPLILGGFSQGAMVAAEITFRSDEPLTALVLLSGSTVDEAGWQQGLAARRGLPVFVSHGQTDVILPFAVADRFRQNLQRAGLQVTWVPFPGGHEIPAEVVVALNQFLGRLPLRR
jgi:phospholipase/carboxylesterase